GFAADDAGLVDDAVRGHAELDRGEAQPFVDRDGNSYHDWDEHDAENETTFRRPMQLETRDDFFARRQRFVQIVHAACGVAGRRGKCCAMSLPVKFATQPSLLVNRRMAMK